MNKLFDVIFVYSSFIFNLSVSALFIATKFGELALMQVFGGVVISLMLPFTITLVGYLREKATKKIDNIECNYPFLSLLGIIIRLHT